MLVNCCSIIGYGWSDMTKYWLKERGEVACNEPVSHTEGRAILISSSFLLHE